MLLAGGFYVLTYGSDAPTNRAELSGLERPATVYTYGGGLPPLVVAATPADAHRALGYAQGSLLAWPIVVARQMARGRVAAWAGTRAMALDRHAALLGFDAHTDTLLASLPEATRATLEAFASGVDAGLADARRHNRFIALSGIHVDPFTARDVLALERLFAWTATEVTWPDSTRLPSEAQAFLATDSLFKAALGAFGWNGSAAWSHADSAGMSLTARYETGSSALPALFECVTVVGSDTTFAAFVPGTPFALAAAGRQAYAVVPRAQARIEQAPGSGWRAEEKAMRSAGGAIVPLTRFVQTGGVLLGADTTRTDTLRAFWRVAWPASVPATDATAWLDLGQNGVAGSFTLLPEATVLVTSPSAVQIGSRQAYASGEVTAPAHVVSDLRVRLDSLDRQASAPPSDWFLDATSPWGQEWGQRLSARIDTALFTAPHQHAAFEFLDNWRGSYRAGSIGATVFDAFARALDLTPGSPATALADTSQPFVRAQYTARFAVVADTLAARYGTDLLRWRWELQHPDTRRFPLWSVRDALDLPLPDPALVRPFSMPGSGHPTTLAGGVAGATSARASHVFVLHPGQPLATRLYRLAFDPTQPFARYRVEGHSLSAQRLTYPANAAATLTLLPR